MRSRTTRYSRRVGQYFENLEERLAFSMTPAPITTTTPTASSLDVNYAQVASGINYNAQTGALNIYGTNADDKVEISQSATQVDINTPPIVVTHVTLGKYEMVNGERTFVVTDSQVLLQNVNHVNFWGYDGDDEFYNMTSIGATAHGGSGNDLLMGGNANDALYGDGGNDKLYARGGNDFLSGGAGNDLLFAGAGSDTLNGAAGNDVLVSIGGGVASLSGGDGVDSFWLDSTETVADATSQEVAGKNIHQVAQFMGYSFDGGQTFAPVGKELNGGNLADPNAIYDADNPVSLQLKNFYDNPLFSANGTSQDDVFQGSVGDCYFMASLSAIADADPNYIQQMVVDLGDGTYAVRFYDQGQEVYVRVDADLYVTDSGDLRYADLGEGGSVWVAIIEKAYAYFRKKQGSYASIASGNGTLQNHLNLDKASWKVDDGITAEQVIAWYNGGSPSGAISDAVHVGAVGLLNWMDAQLAAGQAVYTGARSGIGNGTPLQVDDPATDGNESTFRRGQHVYMVDSILKDGVGNITGVKLRDPYGSYRTLTDFTRIYFCLSAGAAWLVSPYTGPIEMVDTNWEEESFLPLPGDPLVVQPSIDVRVLETAKRTTRDESNRAADESRLLLVEETSKQTLESAVDAAFAKYWGLGGGA